MKIGLAADHGGYHLKEKLSGLLREEGHEIIDFGAHILDDDDDYPDYVIPLAKAIAKGDVERGIAVCGSGVGASVAANKVNGIRAALIHDTFSAHQGVEDDNINVLCLGGRIVGSSLAEEIVITFVKADFTHAERHLRRLSKVNQLENHHTKN